MACTAWLTAMTGSVLLLATCSQASAADDVMATKAPPAATMKALSQPATCSSLEDFVVTACPLTWYGITVYGTIDGGGTWLSHGAPFNGTSAVGAAYLIQKYSNRAQWSLAPNGLSNSNWRADALAGAATKPEAILGLIADHSAAIAATDDAMRHYEVMEPHVTDSVTPLGNPTKSRLRGWTHRSTASKRWQA
jgi:hypothetical protein